MLPSIKTNFSIHLNLLKIIIFSFSYVKSEDPGGQSPNGYASARRPQVLRSEPAVPPLFHSKEDRAMKRHTRFSLIAVLCLGLFCSLLTHDNRARAQGKTVEQKITVLSPRGIPPEIQLKTMAPRLDTLDNKTVYLVDVGYVGTDTLLKAVEDWFKTNMPKVNILYKKKFGFFTSEDRFLWSEIKEKGDAVVMGVGH